MPVSKLRLPRQPAAAVVPRRSNVCESLDVETHGDRRRDRVVAPVTGRGVARAWRHRLIPRRPDVADLGGLLTPCLGCVRPHGRLSGARQPPYDAVVTIRSRTVRRHSRRTSPALSEVRPLPNLKPGPSLPSGGPFCSAGQPSRSFEARDGRWRGRLASLATGCGVARA